MWNVSLLRIAALVLAAGTATACASFPVNPPLTQLDPEQGYRLVTAAPADRAADETFVVVSLSGGGTRALALDYGVLAELDRVEVREGRTLLDEVDIVTGSSAAALASSYLGLRGKESFLSEFPDAVLFRNIQGDLIRSLAAPWNWWRLASRRFSRSDLADEYFDRTIFQGASFRDLPRRRPYILINATDVSRGSQFPFTQAAFDVLCSDLDGVKLSRAVTASLAFTGGFSPVALRNYPSSSCGYRRAPWVDEDLADPLGDIRAHDRAAAWASYEDEARPWVHLLDSGISDNIGTRAVGLAFSRHGEPWSVVDRIDDGRIRRLVVILVDARSDGATKIDRSPKPPGIGAAIGASAGSPMSSVTSDTIAFVQQYLQRLDGVETYFVLVRFAAETEPALRERLENLPTTLALPMDTVQMLIDEAPRLLAASPDYQRLLADLEKVPETAR